MAVKINRLQPAASLSPGLMILGWLFSFLASTYASAESQTVDEDALYPLLPKWEAGVAAGAFYLPDYPGADESRSRFLPLPYVIYRGEIIKADRQGGIRGLFFKNNRMDFDLSFGAGFPARSGENKAREGMPDLDWMGELGPRLSFHLHKGPVVRLDLALPVRYVFTTDLQHWNSRGYIFNPELKFRHRALFDSRTLFSANLGAMWGTEDLADYFYEVSPQYVRSDRPAYDARSGFMGYRTSLSAVRIFSREVVGFLGVSKSFYSDAKNRSSPLLRDVETESYFMGVAWMLHASGRAIPHAGEGLD